MRKTTNTNSWLSSLNGSETRNDRSRPFGRWGPGRRGWRCRRGTCRRGAAAVRAGRAAARSRPGAGPPFWPPRPRSFPWPRAGRGRRRARPPAPRSAPAPRPIAAAQPDPKKTKNEKETVNFSINESNAFEWTTKSPSMLFVHLFPWKSSCRFLVSNIESSRIILSWISSLELYYFSSINNNWRRNRWDPSKDWNYSIITKTGKPFPESFFYCWWIIHDFFYCVANFCYSQLPDQREEKKTNQRNRKKKPRRPPHQIRTRITKTLRNFWWFYGMKGRIIRLSLQGKFV